MTMLYVLDTKIGDRALNVTTSLMEVSAMLKDGNDDEKRAFLKNLKELMDNPPPEPKPEEEEKPEELPPGAEQAPVGEPPAEPAPAA